MPRLFVPWSLFISKLDTTLVRRCDVAIVQFQVQNILIIQPLSFDSTRSPAINWLSKATLHTHQTHQQQKSTSLIRATCLLQPTTSPSQASPTSSPNTPTHQAPPSTLPMAQVNQPNKSQPSSHPSKSAAKPSATAPSSPPCANTAPRNPAPKPAP